MEELIQLCLRILDIDPFGRFIRMINISHHQSIDLSNIFIRQFSICIQEPNSVEQATTFNSYKFNQNIPSFLKGGDVVTIYSKHFSLLKLHMEPYIFVAHDIAKWLTDTHIQTEISINEIIIHCCNISSMTTNDIPLLFIDRSIDSKPYSKKEILQSKQYTRFIYPYCLPIDNIVNPHTQGVSEQNRNELKANTCCENKRNIKHFDSYSRRLTTVPKINRLIKENVGI